MAGGEKTKFKDRNGKRLRIQVLCRVEASGKEKESCSHQEKLDHHHHATTSMKMIREDF
jgi:hypothetical protein